MKSLLVVLSIAFLASVAFAEDVVLRSGQNPTPLRDGPGYPELTMGCITDSYGGFGRTIDSGDFGRARNGRKPYTKNPLVGMSICGDWKHFIHHKQYPVWITATSDGGNGYGDGPSSGKTAIYAVKFHLDKPTKKATLDVQFMVDNNLGDLYNQGVFVNEKPVVGTKFLGDSLDYYHFNQVNSFVPLDITAHVKEGENWVYFYVVNLEPSPSGIQFKATIHTDEGLIEEPKPTDPVVDHMRYTKHLEEEIKRLVLEKDRLITDLQTTQEIMLMKIIKHEEQLEHAQVQIDSLITSTGILARLVTSLKIELSVATEILLEQGDEYFHALADLFYEHIAQVGSLTEKVDFITTTLLDVSNQLSLARIDITKKNSMIDGLDWTVAGLEQHIIELIERAPEAAIPELTKLDLRLGSPADEPIQAVFEMKAGTLLTISVSGDPHIDAFYEIELRQDDIEGELIFCDIVSSSRATLIKNFVAPWDGRYFISVRYHHPDPQASFKMKVKGKKSRR